MEKLLLTLEEECSQRINSETWPRSVKVPDIATKITVLVGMRRTGKTTVLFQKMRTLINNGVSRSRILHINFEDDRLRPITSETMTHMVDAWYSLDPKRHDETCYLFLDEVQNVAGWELTVRRLHETKKVRLFLTGSSAKLLSKEIATELRGRSLTTEIWPLDFEEYPGLESFPSAMGKATQDRYLMSLSNYIEKGGFPETVKVDRSIAVQILQEYIEVVLFRDVLERWNLANLSLLRELFRRLLTMPGRLLSVNKLYNELKGLGYSIGKNTLYEYITHIEDAYLVFQVPLYSDSPKKTLANPRKIYAVDTGLLHSVNVFADRDKGYLFENLIFLALKKRGYQIYYYLTKERYEVDFFAENSSGSRLLVQACWDTTDSQTKEREERALKIAVERTGISGHIVTPETYLKFIRQLDSQIS